MEKIIKEIRELEKKFHDTYMEYYYHLHKNPELSYQEHLTAAYVAEKLRSLPLEDIKTGVGGNGVTAVLRGAKPGPVVAMRADMDALEVTEDTGVEFASLNTGAMHACGHDAHTAMQLGAAHVLCALKNEIAGTIKFIFQPAEEKTPRGGALDMIEAGALENPHVDAIMGLHVRPLHQVGEINLQDGPISSCSDRLVITVKGKASHAALPHKGTDAIVAACAVVGALQSIISRNVNPDDTAVITIGSIQGGTRYNVIAEEVVLNGTVRTFNAEVTKKMPEWITRTAQQTAAAYGATAEVAYTSGYPSAVNAHEPSEICRAAVVDLLGEGGLLPPQGKDPGGEDFAFFAQRVPAAYAFLGCRPKNIKPEDQPALHHARFLPDPGCLPVGVGYLAAAAIKLLAEFKPGK